MTFIIFLSPRCSSRNVGTSSSSHLSRSLFLFPAKNVIRKTQPEIVTSIELPSRGTRLTKKGGRKTPYIKKEKKKKETNPQKRNATGTNVSRSATTFIRKVFPSFLRRHDSYFLKALPDSLSHAVVSSNTVGLGRDGLSLSTVLRLNRGWIVIQLMQSLLAVLNEFH